MSAFLESVERRAFRHALYAVRDREAALDIVQDAMLRLTERYGGRPATEYPMLMQRILQNAIRDYFRRSKVRSTWFSLFSQMGPNDFDEDSQARLENAPRPDSPSYEAAPPERIEKSQTIEIIEQELKDLPPRQRQAFLLRYWEELDVAETASVMGCSEGSVKTHCSRAAHALATALRKRGLTL